MAFPYEYKREFIRAKAVIQERFLQVFAGRHGSPTDQEKMEAFFIKLRGMAELHRDALKSSGKSESDQRSDLREAINGECFQLFGYAGPLYPGLERYRDSLLPERWAIQRSNQDSQPKPTRHLEST